MSEFIDGRFEIRREIGRGGMGVVYDCFDHGMQRKVAIKMLTADLMADTAIMRFKREAAVLSKCNIDGIVKIFSFGSDAGRPYIAMEYLEGQPLSEIIASQGQLTGKQFTTVFSKLLTALKSAHDRGLIHRDIKPSNIIVSELEDPQAAKVTLIDFGLSKTLSPKDKLTRSQVFMGSVHYVSPEICEGKEPDLRSDIYAVGCTMFEAAVGKPPFDGDTFAILLGHVNEKPVGLPSELEPLVMRSLSKAPADRYADAEQFRQALLASPIATGNFKLDANSPPEPKRRATFERLPVVAVTALIATAAMIWVGWQQYQNNWLEESDSLAQKRRDSFDAAIANGDVQGAEASRPDCNKSNDPKDIERLQKLADLEFKKNRLTQAIQAYRADVRLMRRLGASNKQQVYVRMPLAQLYMRTGNMKDAKDDANLAVELSQQPSRDASMRRALSIALTTRAQIHKADNHKQKMASDLERAMLIADKIQETPKDCVVDVYAIAADLTYMMPEYEALTKKGIQLGVQRLQQRRRDFNDHSQDATELPLLEKAEKFGKTDPAWTLRLANSIEKEMAEPETTQPAVLLAIAIALYAVSGEKQHAKEIFTRYLAHVTPQSSESERAGAAHAIHNAVTHGLIPQQEVRKNLQHAYDLCRTQSVDGLPSFIGSALQLGMDYENSGELQRALALFREAKEGCAKAQMAYRKSLALHAAELLEPLEMTASVSIVRVLVRMNQSTAALREREQWTQLITDEAAFWHDVPRPEAVRLANATMDNLLKESRP